MAVYDQTVGNTARNSSILAMLAALCIAGVTRLRPSGAAARTAVRVLIPALGLSSIVLAAFIFGLIAGFITLGVALLLVDMKVNP